MKKSPLTYRFLGLVVLLPLLLPFGSISAQSPETDTEPTPAAPESQNSIASPLANITAPFDWYRYQGEWDGACSTLKADTAPAAVAMAIHFSKNRWVPVNEVRAFMRGGCFKASNHDLIRSALNNWGVNYIEITGAAAVKEAVDIRRHIVIVPVNMPNISQGTDYMQAYSDPSLNKNVYRDPGAHWLVVKGFSSDGQWVFAYDPFVFDGNGLYWYSSQAPKGKDRRYDFAQFQSAMSGTTNTAFEIMDTSPRDNVFGSVRDEFDQPVAQAKVFLTDGFYRSPAVWSGTNGSYKMTAPLRFETAYVIAIKGGTPGKVGAVPFNPSGQDIQISASSAPQIILPERGRVKATFVSTDGSDCTGNFSLVSPHTEDIIQNYLSFGGISYPIEDILEAGTELIFALTPQGVCTNGTYLSTDETRAVISHPTPHTWIIGWEDFTDSDFNDLVVRIDLESTLLPSLKPPVAGIVHTIPANSSRQASEAVELLPPVDAFMDHKYPADSSALAGLYPDSVTFLGDDTSEAYLGTQPTQSYNGNNGTDFRLSSGTPVLAAAAGTTTQVGTANIYCPLDGSTKQANVVKVLHEGGYSTEYWWLQNISIGSGVSVVRSTSQPLGMSGVNGCTGKPGLHFVVRNPSGILVDPFGWKPRLGSPWYAVKDPWRVYNAGQDATSYPLWDLPTTTTEWFNPGVNTVITSPLGISRVTFPGGAYSEPIRIAFTEKESNTFIQDKESQYFFDVVALTQGDRPVTKLLQDASIEITLDPSKVPATEAVYLYIWDLYSLDTAYWRQVPSTWNPATGRLQATISQLGIFATTTKLLPPPPPLPDAKKYLYLTLIRR